MFLAPVIVDIYYVYIVVLLGNFFVVIYPRGNVSDDISYRPQNRFVERIVHTLRSDRASHSWLWRLTCVFVVTHSNFTGQFVVEINNVFDNEQCSLWNVHAISAIPNGKFPKSVIPASKVHGANMRPTWVLSAPDGPYVGPMNLAIRDGITNSGRNLSLWTC